MSEATPLHDPESIVRSFIADYCRWSDRANALTEKDTSWETFELVDADYTELLDRYCRPGFLGKNVASRFGRRRCATQRLRRSEK